MCTSQNTPRTMAAATATASRRSSWGSSWPAFMHEFWRPDGESLAADVSATGSGSWMPVGPLPCPLAEDEDEDAPAPWCLLRAGVVRALIRGSVWTRATGRQLPSRLHQADGLCTSDVRAHSPVPCFATLDCRYCMIQPGHRMDQNGIFFTPARFSAHSI